MILVGLPYLNLSELCNNYKYEYFSILSLNAVGLLLCYYWTLKKSVAKDHFYCNFVLLS